MAITINGSGSISGISTGGLPNDCVTTADLEYAGTSGQVLTSTGSTTAPTWQDSTGITWLNTQSVSSGGAVTITGIDTNARMILVSFFRVSQSTNSTNQIYMRVGQGTVSSGNDYYWCVSRGVSYNSVNTAQSSYRLLVTAYTDSAHVFNGNIMLLRTKDSSTPSWSITHQLSENGGANEPQYGSGSYQSTLIDRIQFVPEGNFDNGEIRVGYII